MRTKKKRDYLGLGLLVTAFVMTVVFIVTCIKKKNILSALAAVAAVNAVGGWWVFRCNRHNGNFFDFFDENHCEAFEQDKVYKAKREQRLAECGYTNMPVYEIPIDEETTEEDFAK